MGSLILPQARADLVGETHTGKIATEVQEVGLDAEPLLAAFLGRFLLYYKHLWLRDALSVLQQAESSAEGFVT